MQLLYPAMSLFANMLDMSNGESSSRNPSYIGVVRIAIFRFRMKMVTT